MPYSQCARLRHFIFHLLTTFYRRHFESSDPVDKATKASRNAELLLKLKQFVHARMTASGRCAQFDTTLVLSAKSCDSVSINRCSHITYHTLHFLTHAQDKLAVIDYRPESGNVEVRPIFIFLLMFDVYNLTVLICSSPVWLQTCCWATRHRRASRTSKCAHF